MIIIDLKEVFEGSEEMFLRIIDELKKNLENINDILVEEAKEKNFDLSNFEEKDLRELDIIFK
jgi:hypothetical protein